MKQEIKISLKLKGANRYLIADDLSKSIILTPIPKKFEPSLPFDPHPSNMHNPMQWDGSTWRGRNAPATGIGGSRQVGPLCPPQSPHPKIDP